MSANPTIDANRRHFKINSIPLNLAAHKQNQNQQKPSWIRVRAPNTHSRFRDVKAILRRHQLNTVCEEAACPNIGECFGKGIATFMIMGNLCTRRCTFCKVGHGRPQPLDVDEPAKLAQVVSDLQLRYVVITSVNRDDLHDGGAQHFVECISQIRQQTPGVRIEVLVPDFRKHVDLALSIFGKNLPDVMNHNLETVPRLYKQARPGAVYENSLKLLEDFKTRYPGVLTKSGIMLGLGEDNSEVLQVMQDIRRHGVDMLTIGQYLRPSSQHLPVLRYVDLEQFDFFKRSAYKMGFKYTAAGPLVRSSYCADQQVEGLFTS